MAVIIAVPVAKTQAAATGHSLMVELQMLAIHGTLQLLGYDHHTPQGQAPAQKPHPMHRFSSTAYS